MAKEESKKDVEETVAPYNPQDMVQVICPECRASNIINLKRTKKAHCFACGRALNLPKISKAKESE